MKTKDSYGEIKVWFDSGKPFNTGLKLFHKYSTNGYDKMRLLRMSMQNKQTFIEGRLREIMEKNKPKTKRQAIKQPSQAGQTTNKVAPKNTTKFPPVQERLQTEFPKIVFSQLPDTLKLLVFKRYDAWQKAVEHHKKQHEAETDKERFEAAKQTVLSKQENWQIWEELHHWHQYNKPLGKHESFQENDFLKAIREAEANKPAAEVAKMLITIRKRARNNINEYLRKDGLTPEQEQKKAQWVWKHDIVSKKLGEPLWEK